MTKKDAVNTASFFLSSDSGLPTSVFRLLSSDFLVFHEPCRAQHPGVHHVVGGCIAENEIQY